MGALARVGGRNSWIAVPAGIGCLAVVAALVWLSLPMVPVTVAWAGDMLRNATAPAPAATAEDTPARRIIEGASVDCRALYPDGLWNEMMWSGRSLLDQGADPPPTAATTLNEVLAPHARLTCAWTRADGATVVSSLSAVGPDAPGLVESALRGQGYSCEAGGETLRCTGGSGDAAETHVVRDGVWAVSVETGWHPEDYAARLERQVFG